MVSIILSRAVMAMTVSAAMMSLVGTVLGGTRITLRGSGFSSRPGMTCRLGSTIVSTEWMSNIEIVCTSPPAGGVVISNSLSVSLNGMDSRRLPSIIVILKVPWCTRYYHRK